MSRIGLVALVAFCLPFAALAQGGSLPDLYEVTGVQTGDTLNVRAAPDSKSSVLGELAPGTKGVEVVELDASGKWARVNMQEWAGWVSTRFLTAQPSVWKQGELPQNLSCFGTEPFWTMRHTDGGMTLSSPDSAERRLEIRKVMDRGFDGDRTRAVIAGDDAGRVTAVIQPQMCSDGMSDRSFGLGAILVMDGAGTASTMRSGCCSIAR